MKAWIIYDSVFGNTEKIALAMGNALGSPVDVKVIKASEARPDQISSLNLLIVGSPTQRFGPTAPISNLFEIIPKNGLAGVKVAAFDTRLTMDEINKTSVLAFFVRLFGTHAYAAGRIANQLRKKGGELVRSPEGFFVHGMEGPLIEGELDRAADWARQIMAES